MTYAELRAANARAYCRENAAFFGLVPTWGPLADCANQMGPGNDSQSLFNRIHDAGIQAIADQQNQVDWSQTYAAIKPFLDARTLITAIQSARWELVTSASSHADGPRLTDKVLTRHIGDAFAHAGKSSSTTAIDPATLLATIITAVLGVLCPPTAALSAILEPIIAVIIKVLFSSLTAEFSSGNFGASPGAFNAQLEAWAREAQAS